MCTIYKVRGGKWDGEDAVLNYKTKKGFYVWLINIELTNYERLVFSATNKVYAVKPKLRRAYVQNIVATSQIYTHNPNDNTNSGRLLNKWYGKSHHYVLEHIRM